MSARRRRGPLRILWFLHVWGPVAAVMAVLFAASGSSILPVLPVSVSDVAAHAAAYAVLGALLLRALTGADWSRATPRGVLLAVLLAACHGVLGELHQSFVPGRTPELRDLAADVAGAAAGAVAAWRWTIVRTVPAPRRVR